MQDQEKPFYVYVHKYASGPKEGQVFYVGKGRDYRAWTKSGRSVYWRNIVNKYGFSCHIVMRFYREECALSFEIALIKHYGRENLCNLTDGGDGTSGFPCSDERREKIRASNIGRIRGPQSQDHKEKIRNSCIGRIHTEEHKRKISSAHMGRKNGPHSSETKAKIGRSSSGSGNGVYDHTVRIFINDEGFRFVGTKYNFRVKFGLKQSSVSNLCSGKLKKHKGWSFLGIDDNLE